MQRHKARKIVGEMFSNMLCSAAIVLRLNFRSSSAGRYPRSDRLDQLGSSCSSLNAEQRQAWDMTASGLQATTAEGHDMVGRSCRAVPALFSCLYAAG
jgi:hypothetical protein